MKRTRPLFNFRKETSSTPSVPKDSSGGNISGTRGGGFYSSPKLTSPEEGTSHRETATRPKDSRDNDQANASQRSQTASILKRVKRKMSPIPPEDEGGGVRERRNRKCKWKYASTPWTLRETNGRTFHPSKIRPSDNSVVRRRPEFVGIEMPPEEVNTPENESVGCWKRLVRSCGAACRKCRGRWKAFMKSKREWDNWNPDKSNPFVAFINESKLAGLKESIKPDQGILYRILWVTLFFVAFGCGTAINVNTYRFHYATPVLFALATREIKTSDLPYPTLTTSPYSSFKGSSVAKYLSMYTNNKDLHENWTKSTVARLLYLMEQPCQSNAGFRAQHKGQSKSALESSTFKDILNKVDLTDRVDENLFNKTIPAIKEASQSCSEMLSYCSWNANATDSCSSFTPTFKATGGSCAFNKMPDKNLYKDQSSFKSIWSREEEQSEDWGNWSLENHLRNIHTAPRGDLKGPKRQAAGGSPWGLWFLMTMNDPEQMECPQFHSPGTRVSISVPGVDVDVERDNIVVHPHHEASFKLYPDLTIADDNLRTILPPSRRGCFFEDERNLTYYKSYNQENCRRECIADHILRNCECTLLSHPNSKEQTICNKQKFECVLDAERQLVDPKTSPVAEQYCSHCLPSCTSMSLRVETVLTPYSKDNAPPLGIDNMTSLGHAYYAQDSVVAKVRERRHTDYEMISSAGATYESTNDVSWLGVARILVALTRFTVFIPTAYTYYKLLQFICLSCCLLFRKLNIRLFQLQNRLAIHPKDPPKKRVRFADEEENSSRDDNSQNKFTPRSTNFDIFLLDSSHIVLPMPPPPSSLEPQPPTSWGWGSGAARRRAPTLPVYTTTPITTPLKRS